jgi:hypothetical protein
MVLHHSLRLAKWREFVHRTLAESYVKLVEKPHLASDEIRKRIELMIRKELKNKIV